MTYKQCDRCKKSTEINKNLQFRKIIILKEDAVTVEPYDLCDYCINDLKNFLLKGLPVEETIK